MVPLRVNLGCGKKRVGTYVETDIDISARPDVVLDATALPFADGSIDEILCVHMFEHLWPEDIKPTLAEWRRALKPSGTLILELPCLDKVLRNYLISDNVSPQLTSWGLFGDPATLTGHNVWALHKYCWGSHELESTLREAKFTVVFERPQFHVESRDMRLVACK
ncbi:MAG: class I SAM-dependent methyltransferase, partial [Nitrososphaerales archaeon]